MKVSQGLVSRYCEEVGKGGSTGPVYLWISALVTFESTNLTTVGICGSSSSPQNDSLVYSWPIDTLHIDMHQIHYYTTNDIDECMNGRTE